jgi:hypothetical protein
MSFFYAPPAYEKKEVNLTTISQNLTEHKTNFPPVTTTMYAFREKTIEEKCILFSG